MNSAMATPSATTTSTSTSTTVSPVPTLIPSVPRTPTGQFIPRQVLREEGQRQRRLEVERHVRSLAGIVAQACVEAELGMRPARQLAAWLDLDTYGKMVRRADLAERTRTDRSAQTSPRTLQARCCRISATVFEASASVHCGGRVRALALRIELRRDRWKVTAMEMG